jgi:hypothetical protein
LNNPGRFTVYSENIPKPVIARRHSPTTLAPAVGAGVPEIIFEMVCRKLTLESDIPPLARSTSNEGGRDRARFYGAGY